MPSNKNENCSKYLALFTLLFFAVNEARALAEQELVARKIKEILLLKRGANSTAEKLMSICASK